MDGGFTMSELMNYTCVVETSVRCAGDQCGCGGGGDGGLTDLDVVEGAQAVVPGWYQVRQQVIQEGNEPVYRLTTCRTTH